MRRAAFVALLLASCATDDPERSMFAGEPFDERGLPLLEACPPSVDPEKGPVQGIDISKYQTVSDWSKVAAAETFVIIKATQGTSSVDPSFASHRAGAKGQGMVVGYYHYLNFSSSGSAQADNFIKTVGSLEPGELPPMLDIEDNTTGAANSPAANLKIALDWLAKVEQALGKKPMIYTGGGFWGGPNFGNPPELASYAFCWSRYSQSNSCPKVPDNLVPQIKFWQFRADPIPQYNIPAGQTPGINGAVDQDVFYGDMAAFQAFIGGGAVSGPKYAAKYVNQSYPLAAQGAVEVKVGQKVTGSFEMKNTGTETWKPGVVFLAPIPRDQASPYQADTWVSASRVSTVSAETKPGDVGVFALDIGGQTPGDGSLKLGWVAEGITWFADAPLGGGPEDGVAEVKVKVLPADPGGGGSGGSGAAGSGSGGAPPAAGSGGSPGEAGKGGAPPAAGSGGSPPAAGSSGKGEAGQAAAGKASGGSGGQAEAGSSGKRSSSPQVTVEETSSPDDGCGCRAAPSRGTPFSFAIPLAALCGALRRRARRSPSP